MVREQIPMLSKSRFLAGLQCPRRLYLGCFHTDLADSVPTAEQAKLDAGTIICELARVLYAVAMLIAEPYFRHEDAVATTR
jgi:hypothetical protein